MAGMLDFIQDQDQDQDQDHRGYRESCSCFSFTWIAPIPPLIFNRVNQIVHGAYLPKHEIIYFYPDMNQ